MRQSAFPGIMVESLRIDAQTPPDRGFILSETTNVDQEAILKQAVNRGMTKEFETLQRAADFTDKTVNEFITNAESHIGPFLDSFKLVYELKVAAKPQVTDIRLLNMVNQQTDERSVSGRARLFVRVKNPFEPEILEVTKPTKDTALSSEKIGDVYDVSVMVTK